MKIYIISNKYLRIGFKLLLKLVVVLNGPVLVLASEISVRCADSDVKFSI